MSISTQIFNGTKHAMKVLVGSGRYAAELATVAAGGKYVIGVDYNATYREYSVGVDAPGLEKYFVVSSDDLCDNACITIKEEDSKLTVQKEPRQSSSTATATDPATSFNSAKKHSWLPSWVSKYMP